jgi:tetratricopeptide (TPR) repeat protein/SAM-dependent methyltransferase
MIVTGDEEQINSIRSRGLELMQANRLAEARERFSKLVTLIPEDVDAWYRLSSINGRLGYIDDAEACCRRVLALQADHGDAYVNLGHVYSRRGDFQEALKHYQTAARFNPDSHVAYFNMGIVFHALGKEVDAMESYRHAISLSPGYADAHNNLGSMYLQRGELSAAYSCYEKVLQIDPCYVTALNNLARTVQSQAQIARYAELYRQAVARLPDPAEARRDFINISRKFRATSYVPWLEEELRKCLFMKDVEYNPLGPLTAHLLKDKYDIRAPAGLDPGKIEGMAERIASDDLFILYIEKLVNIDADLESLFTSLRRILLSKSEPIANLSYHEIRVISALAHQCFNNEYIFAVDAEEEARLDHLKRAVELLVDASPAPDQALECMLFIIGMYENLFSLSCAKRLAGYPLAAWSERFRPYAEHALYNYFEEQRIKEKIESVTAIRDQTTQLVQSQYEDNPYPRWISFSKRRSEIDIKQRLKTLFPHFTPPPFLDGPLQILVAGCGTGKHPIQAALRYGNAEILAVDISKSSLAYAIRMARKHEVKNVKFMQGDILDLAALRRRFHIIECCGVLHHMQDPLAGWKVLTGLLAEDGLMLVALYSELARKGIVAAREIIKREALAPNREALRNFRARVLRRELGDLLYAFKDNRNDFYSASGCRDLFFHYQEHRYTLPQLRKELNELNLDFIGFAFDNIETPNLYRSQFPEDTPMRDLVSWDRFENLYPATFASMYEFWCQKKDKNSIVAEPGS